MKRTLSATFRFLRSDLAAAGVIALLVVLLATGLNVMVALLDSPQNAPLVMMVTLIFGNGICAMVFSIVYFSNWFTTLLAFPASRRGLLVAILLFCLSLSAGLLVLTLLAGSLCTLILGAALGCTLAMPWQVTPPGSSGRWPCCCRRCLGWSWAGCKAGSARGPSGCCTSGS